MSTPSDSSHREYQALALQGMSTRMDTVLGSPSPVRTRQRCGTPARRRDVSADNAEKTPGRRKACNECKQQKLRCEFGPGGDARSRVACKRCHKLELDCRVEEGFRRTRKRRRSVDLENEIRDLRRQLQERRDAPNVASGSTVSMPNSTTQWETPSASGALPVASFHGNLVQARVHGAPSSIETLAPDPSVSGPAVDNDTTEPSRAAGLTTRPDVDETCPRKPVQIPLPRPRALGNTALSVEEIDELFNIYITYYHPFLPLIDTTKSPHEYYQLSELLFWAIISVASRRIVPQPTLLPKLARNVTDLLWRTLRSVPHSLATVQGLALLCSWPFPTSSSTADPTFMLVGTMMQIGTQMGLHRALDAQDFTKVPTRLSGLEYAEWIRTWEACNIVARSVSVGCGLPIFIQTFDWTLPARPETEIPEILTLGMPFWYRLKIEKFRLRVSYSLGSQVPEIGPNTAPRERLIVYGLLNSELADLESEEPGAAAFSTWFLAASRLHLHTFYLFDDTSTEGYNDRIITLYTTAYSLIELSLTYDSQETGFFNYCPFFCYQVFVCAAFVILKILMNGFFRLILDVQSGMKLLEAAISSLRKISVVNNDLPARLGDVIAFFCALRDPTVIGGTGVADLRLRQVKNRLSMSVVYDCLWTWRKHFQTEEDGGRGRDNSFDAEDKSSSPIPFVAYLERF